ncbi:hypothetical protein RI129_007762 [Pyrocoelia pectoralis]|uniref:Peptidase S1 domain-containing protein n=1 Tax=Pyrocoelia pectoralis TaxID=417401 RepID=A0AAN7VA93_9COLE
MICLGLTLSKTDLLAPRSYCGLQHTDDYPRANNNISLDEFPWMAQLLYDEDKQVIVKCVGSLINRRYVISTVFCTVPFGDSKLTGVRLGDFNLRTDTDCLNHTRFGEECSDPVQEFSIEEVIRHPKYKKRLSSNDIALIRLSTNVDYSEYVRPICLPTSKDLDLVDGTQLALSGWGDDTKLISLDECQRLYNDSRKPVTSDHLCALEGRESFTCQGDGGGPLMLSVKNQWEQVGIVAFGKACGLDFPSVYVKITSYLDWIKENLRE